jgi:hypothetical protein
MLAVCSVYMFITIMEWFGAQNNSTISIKKNNWKYNIACGKITENPQRDREEMDLSWNTSKMIKQNTRYDEDR